MTTSYDISNRIRLVRSNLEINFNQSNTLDASSFVFHQLEDISDVMGPGLLGAVGDISQDTSGTRFIIPSEHKAMIFGTSSNDELIRTLSNYTSDTDNSNSPAVFLQVNDNKVEINGKNGIIFDCSEVKINELTTLSIPSTTTFTSTDISATSTIISNSYIYSNNSSNLYVNTLDIKNGATFTHERITKLSNDVTSLEERVGYVSTTEFDNLSNTMNDAQSAYTPASNGIQYFPINNSNSSTRFGIPKYNYGIGISGEFKVDGATNTKYFINPSRLNQNIYLDVSSENVELYLPGNRSNKTMDLQIMCLLGPERTLTLYGYKDSNILWNEVDDAILSDVEYDSNSPYYAFGGNFTDSTSLNDSGSSNTISKFWISARYSNSDITNKHFLKIRAFSFTIDGSTPYRYLVYNKLGNSNIESSGVNP
jgi:hypothetical protein